MKKYTPEQKAQALKLLEQDGATAATVARTMGIPPRTVRDWAKARADAPSNVLSIEEMRERAQRAVEATPQAAVRRLKNHFVQRQYELLQRHASDLQALRSASLQAMLEKDATMVKAISGLMTSLLKAQERERLIYEIKPGTEADIMRQGMNRQQS
ncbi:transposase [Enterobacter sp. BT855]|nr:MULTISPECIES: transposase [Enterobacteriaceae]HAF2548959.1 transposase [Salmonella enterica]EHH6290853.1 transposase [Escherichia coli]EKL0723922.1 helix-turn-helix domain-containing protein [Citrobacter freundii]EKX5205110.1 helix-turn-helix domain-containing protein [Citrobacter freundii]EKX5205358.1 helix-turn-helix domain-containing protein [Citrobacter freundii]